ncbi:MAG TPA: cyclic nucleotide-binding domain-containing protein [Candidatus Polarisedimenticolaceae bacterium]
MGSALDSLPALLAKKDYARALRVLQAEIDAKPKSFPVRRQYAEVLALAGRRRDAIDAYEALFESSLEEGYFPRATAILAQIAKLAPDRKTDVEEMRARVAERERKATQFASAIRKPPSRTSAEPRKAKFRGVPEKAIPEIFERATIVEYAAGQVVYEEGTEGNSLFLIQDGSVRKDMKRAEGDSVMITTLIAGELFGEAAVLTGKPRAATVTAREACVLLEMSRAGMEDVMSRHPELKEALEARLRESAARAMAALKK